MPIDISGSDLIEVVGESFYREALRELARSHGAGRSLAATLVCDPANPYDRNAVKVMIEGQQVGHLPRELAALVAEPIAELEAAHEEVTSTAQLRGSDPDFGLGVVLYLDLERLGVSTVDPEDPPLVDIDNPPAAANVATSGVAEATSAPAAAEIPDSGRRRATVERAVERWKSELIDLTGRNRLLYMRDLRSGTLNFDASARDVLMQLVAGKKVVLSKLVPRSRPPESPQAKLTPFEDALRRMRTIVRTARSYEEERGVRTLFLACGVATWRNERASRPPAAPVLLVPLAIRARGASQQDFELSLAGDLEVNPTLLHMLKVEFNLDVDDQELYRHAEMDGVIDTPEELRLTYNWLSEQCRSVSDWAIADRFVLGNFWYAKLPMVKDLEGSIDTLTSHDVAAAFAGDSEARQAVLATRASGGDSPASLDAVPPIEEFNVLDSDSSQSHAIARARAGESMVLKGPPGTGKSQTIANLICHAIGEGKRVLFVAEKRAAIEAVTKRLHGAGLDELVLDLHQGAESRKWLAKQLDTSLETVRRTADVAWRTEEERLTRAREVLKGHADGLHHKHAPWDVSVLEAQVELLARGRPTVATRLRGPDLEAVGEGQLAELDEALRDLLSMEGLSLRAKNSPWSEATVNTADLAREVISLVDELDQALPRLREGVAKACSSTALPEPRDPATAEATMKAWEAASARAETFDEEIFEENLDAHIAALEPLQGSSFSRLMAALTSTEFRAARGAVKEHLREEREPEPPNLYGELLACRDLRQVWSDLSSAGGSPRFPADLAPLRAAFEGLKASLARLSELVGRDLSSLPFEEMAATVAALRAGADTARILPSIHEARQRFTAVGLESFLGELEEQQGLLPEARQELERVWWQSLVDHLMLLPASDELSAFRGERHDQVLQEFRDLDRQHVTATAGRIRRIAAETAIEAQNKFPDQAQLVKAQAKRKRGHMPVRELFARAPDVITALRPCWVMSPLMVSQLIPSDGAYFDLVVFDEASQVRPVEALTSMIRGMQLVVAGDNHQLPPTAFFDATAVGDNESGDEEDEESTDIADYESLLDVLMTLFDTEMLRWHYRSRDERLIGFSNQEIYEGELTTFPGIVDGEVLSHVWVDKEPGPDEARVSPDAEVRQVVELVLEHARTRSHESLGVIALGIQHAEAIEAGLLTQLPEHPDLESFFDEDREERFFVKNLERVQGDERDAIILAVGYGKLPDGTLPHRFGPLNNTGGERRLNVAVTRAKQRMTVVSSFKAEDVDPKRSSAQGVQLLRAFLAYAARGGEAEGFADGAGEPTALHRLVSDSLQTVGFETQELVGTSADRIDVAVVDPEHGVPTVAIEFDGDAYARRPSVRDRDRLRAEHLKRLGWRCIPLWSQDWYRDPAGGAQRLAERIRAELEAARAEPAENASAVKKSDDAVAEATSARSRGPRPNVTPTGPAITDWRSRDLVRLAEWIESDGLLRTDEELQRELMEEIGITRRGSRVARVLDQVVATLRSRSA